VTARDIVVAEELGDATTAAWNAWWCRVRGEVVFKLGH